MQPATLSVAEQSGWLMSLAALTVVVVVSRASSVDVGLTRDNPATEAELSAIPFSE